MFNINKINVVSKLYFQLKIPYFIARYENDFNT